MYNRTFSDLSLPHFLFPSGAGGGERGVGERGGRGEGGGMGVVALMGEYPMGKRPKDPNLPPVSWPLKGK